MVLEEKVRELARSFYWQRIYTSSKEVNGVRLFDNENNFSGIQAVFLFWLEVYFIIYKELANKEWDNLDNEVIKDNTRMDAFLYWRAKQQEQQLYKMKQQEQEYKAKDKKSSANNVRQHKVFKGVKKAK